jgi:hypothetical protein
MIAVYSPIPNAGTRTMSGDGAVRSVYSGTTMSPPLSRTGFFDVDTV